MKEATKQVFAVIRLDVFLLGTSPATNSVTIKEIVSTREKAESEVQRLTEINRDKNCVYFWQMTRWVE